MKKTLIIISILMTTISCKRQDDWLDIKSNKADVVPTTLKDYQALIDNNAVMCLTPALGLLGADDYYLSDATAQTGGTITDRNAYIWAKDTYTGVSGEVISDWAGPYTVVEYSNVILDGISKISLTVANKDDWNNVRGSALFFRAFSFFNLAQLYAKSYVSSTASTDLGIPLRLSSDINEKSVRATVQECYDRIILDLNEALTLLPTTPLYKTRPGKATVYALLAKVYLNMENYSLAYDNADNALKINNSLLNYNTVNGTRSYPFPTYQTNNPEVIFYATMLAYNIMLIGQLVDEDLYKQYDAEDLRKTLFYSINADGTKKFRGRYTGSSGFFSGFANDELYLIKSECLARTGNIPESMNVLNLLLVTRWITGTYIPYTAVTETDALTIILKERRKEMPFTGNTRWEDLRRLNRDTRFAKTLTRTVNGIVYTLPPNDPKYVYPIIPREIVLSGLQQNQR